MESLFPPLDTAAASATFLCALVPCSSVPDSSTTSTNRHHAFRPPSRFFNAENTGILACTRTRKLSSVC